MNWFIDADGQIGLRDKRGYVEAEEGTDVIAWLTKDEIMAMLEAIERWETDMERAH